MHVTGPNPELAGPNICALCEQKPEGARFADTGLNNNYMPPTPLTGRKYVCEVCVGHLASAFGLPMIRDYEQMHVRLGNAQQIIDDLKAENERLKSEAVQEFMKLVAPRVRAKAASS